MMGPHQTQMKAQPLMPMASIHLEMTIGGHGKEEDPDMTTAFDQVILRRPAGCSTANHLNEN